MHSNIKPRSSSRSLSSGLNIAFILLRNRAKENDHTSVSASLLLSDTVNMVFTLSPSQFEDPAFLRLPALLPPPEVTPNFVHPEDRGPVLVFVGGTLSALMLMSIGIRAYTKLVIVRKLSWDDLTISFSAISALSSYIVFVWGMFASKA